MSLKQKETLSCSVCLDLLKEPVTIPCGHSYCKTCISSFWDGEEDVYSCPQCRQTFTPRPVLMKSTMLAQLVEQMEEEAAGGSSFAADEDVVCDVCTGKKRKASMSCVNCVTSYCEEHLQKHNEVTPSKRHRLVDPSRNLQEIICSRHDEVMTMFCRTDQQCICFLCSMEEHKGHHMVSAAAEYMERQRELQDSQVQIHKNIQDRKNARHLFKEELKIIRFSADHTLQHNQQMMTELIRVLHRRSSELEKDVRTRQKTEERAVRVLQEKLEQEISVLKERDAELGQISTTEDHVQFLLSYSSLSALSVSTHSSSTHTHPRSCFLELTEHLHTVLKEDWTKVCGPLERVEDLQLPEPTSRAGFLQYSQNITLDPNTAHKQLRLTKRNRKVTSMGEDQHHHPHQDRFTRGSQVLSRETLTGRSYWEVEVRGGGVGVAVAYKSMSRDSVFGSNDKSWMLVCYKNHFCFIHNNIRTKVSGRDTSRVGVYVDHAAATLIFYSDTMTPLHRVNTTFSEPLHVGLSLNHYNFGTNAEFSKL